MAYFATVTLPRQPRDRLAAMEIQREIADSAHIFGAVLRTMKGRVFVYEFEDRKSAEFFKNDQPGILSKRLTIKLSKEAPD